MVQQVRLPGSVTEQITIMVAVDDSTRPEHDGCSTEAFVGGERKKSPPP